MLVDPALQRRRRKRAGDARYLLTVVEQDHGGNATDTKPLGEVRGVIAVDLHQLEPAGQVLRNLFDDRRDNPAGAAPWSPEVHEDGQRALLHDGREIGFATFG